MAIQNNTVEMVTCLKGVRKIAEREGVSREWVWMVRTGRGTSARIAAALKAEGISVEPRRRGR
jgi:hypothetical protein